MYDPKSVHRPRPEPAIPPKPKKRPSGTDRLGSGRHNTAGYHENKDNDDDGILDAVAEVVADAVDIGGDFFD
jgi:hypothetical protein